MILSHLQIWDYNISPVQRRTATRRTAPDSEEDENEDEHSGLDLATCLELGFTEELKDFVRSRNEAFLSKFPSLFVSLLIIRC